MNKRVQEINYLKNKGLTSKEINDVLVEAGRDALTTAERKGLPKTKGWDAIWEAAGRNFAEIPAGLATMAGLGVRALGDVATIGRDEPWRQGTPSYEESLKRQTKAGQYIGELLLDPRNVINVPLAPYNITTSRIGTSIKKTFGLPTEGKKPLSLDDTLYGIAENPVFFGMDMAPAIVRPIRSAWRQTKAAKRIDELSEFNRLLNTAKVAGAPTAQEVNAQAKIARQFDALPLNEQVAISEALQKTGARDVGSKKANEVLKSMRVSSKMAARELQNMGMLDKATHNKNMLATYIGNNLNWITPEGTPLNHSVIMEMINKPEKLTGVYKDLYNAGQSHVKKGNIAFVTQSINPANVNLLGTPTGSAGSWLTAERIVGTRTPEEMVKVLPAAIKKQATYAGSLKEAEKLMDLIKDYKPTAQAKTYISTKDFDKYLKESFNKGKSYREIIDHIPTIEKPTAAQIAKGEVIGLPEMELNALRRFGGYSGPSGATNWFKRSVLGSLKWFIENRTGNWLNNMIEGVGPQAMAKGWEIRKTAPTQLDKLTRAYGYAQDRPQRGLGFKEALERTTEGAKALGIAVKEKDLSRGLRGLKNLVLGPADLFSVPMFTAEAAADRLERLMNLARQVGEKAKKTKQPTEAIWKEVYDNPKKFDELFRNVNRSLGDYTSRNYYMPSAIETLRSDLFPFYKFYTNTAGVTARQLVDRPLGTQLLLTGPAKAGEAIRENLVDRGVIKDKAIEGGYPTGELNPRGEVEMVGSEAVPLGALSKLIGSTYNIGAKGPKELVNIISPFLGLKDTLALQNAFDKTLSSPRWEEEDGVLYSVNKEGYPTLQPYNISQLEYLGLIAGQLAKQGYSPVARARDIRRIARGAFEPLVKQQQGVIYPMYDTQLNPFAEGDTSRMPAIGALETLGPLAGIRVRPDVDYTKKATMRGFKRLVRKRARRKGGNY